LLRYFHTSVMVGLVQIVEQKVEVVILAVVAGN
jgi:hypothetical protein